MNDSLKSPGLERSKYMLSYPTSTFCKEAVSTKQGKLRDQTNVRKGRHSPRDLHWICFSIRGLKNQIAQAAAENGQFIFHADR